ncbi:GNAT family N-acetyltransferase [Thalassococcus sp. BH17M4-6]|uniref:GNAT family N-acetyltransferase n=1 Tax=Thalassococcus sp. BH17M4-6 TaxID=3413148 RepID=UPI003BC8CA75
MAVELRDLEPDDVPWLVDQHGQHYARAEGFDDSFGALVGDILQAYVRDRDPTCERAWIAVEEGQRLGSIFCVREDAQTAKLRLFLLAPAARGRGLGKRLLSTCMTYAKARGYRQMRLWTHESHRAACALYARTGWTLNSSRPVRSFGVDLVEQAWSIRLDQAGIGACNDD